MSEHEHQWDALQVSDTVVHRACTVCRHVEEDVFVSQGHVVTVGHAPHFGWEWSCSCGEVGATAGRSGAFSHIDSPEAGHTFRITVEMRSSNVVRGQRFHQDGAEFELVPNQVTVRAWNLSDALEKAAKLPLDDWFEEDE